MGDFLGKSMYEPELENIYAGMGIVVAKGDIRGLNGKIIIADDFHICKHTENEIRMIRNGIGAARGGRDTYHTMDDNSGSWEANEST